jgi:hypothetical protein
LRAEANRDADHPDRIAEALSRGARRVGQVHQACSGAAGRRRPARRVKARPMGGGILTAQTPGVDRRCRHHRRRHAWSVARRPRANLQRV